MKHVTGIGVLFYLIEVKEDIFEKFKQPDF